MRLVANTQGARMPSALRSTPALPCVALAVMAGLVFAAPNPGKPSRPRSYADRDELLIKVSERFECKAKPEAHKGWCAALDGYPTGTTEEFAPGTQLLAGLMMRVDLGSGDAAFTEDPAVSALAISHEGRQTYGGFADVKPDGSVDKKRLADVAAQLGRILSGEPGTPSLPESVARNIELWAREGLRQMYRERTGWQFAGLMGELRKVGPYWVIVGAPKNKTGILFGVYTAYSKVPDAASPDGGTRAPGAR
jgi:hypothetical protein